jgi:hypothetical protein
VRCRDVAHLFFLLILAGAAMRKSYKTERKRIGKDFKKLLENFRDLFYYGCEVDMWLPEIMLLPYVSLGWKQDPTWFRCIAPPGSGKSVHLNTLSDYEGSYVIDEFTPKSFISGFRTQSGEDPSKLPQFNGKVLIISDESTLMEQRQEDRNLVQSIMRKAYDGRVSKVFGNLKEAQTYESRFNLLVASTPQIDRYFVYNQALGERYLNFRLQVPNRLGLVEVAYANQFRDFKDRYATLTERVHHFLRRIPRTRITDISVPDEVKHKFIHCADFIACVRTRITRDATGRHVTTLPQAETAGRLVKQMTQAAIASAIINGETEVTPEQVRKAIYIASCSVIAVTTFIVYHVWKFTQEARQDKDGGWFSIQLMVLRTQLGRASVTRTLEDLAIHRILEVRAGKKQGGRQIDYKLSEYAIGILKSTGLFDDYVPPVKEILTMKRADRDRPTGTKHKSTPRKKVYRRKGKV